jgi:hypothetical protein
MKKNSKKINHGLQGYFFRTALDNLMRQGEVVYDPQTRTFSLASNMCKEQGKDESEKGIKNK